MPRNVEIKARIASVEALTVRASAIATEGPIAIAQDDTFFPCETGRLKLRAFSAERGELIYYRRPDQHGPKESFYIVSPTSAPDALRESLTLAHGNIGRVIKQRTLFLAGRTRIHLDRVEGLGDFLELEVVLEEHEPTEAGVQEAHAVMAQLGVAPSQLIEGAYLDLLKHAAAVAAPPSMEIERKFLVVAPVESLARSSTRVVQGYLNSHPDRSVRVRIAGDRGVLTVKGATDATGTRRFEWERDIAVAEAEALLELCEPGVIRKVRHEVPVGGHVFEVDVFEGENAGLVLAEVELASPDEAYERPAWLGREVTGDARYYNAALAAMPYQRWGHQT